jgi:hypothetical protein
MITANLQSIKTFGGFLVPQGVRLKAKAVLLHQYYGVFALITLTGH